MLNLLFILSRKVESARGDGYFIYRKHILMKNVENTEQLAAVNQKVVREGERYLHL